MAGPPQTARCYVIAPSDEPGVTSGKSSAPLFNDTPPVSCERPHSNVTLAVVHVPITFQLSSSSEVTSIQREVFCERQFHRATGRSAAELNPTFLQLRAFIPDDAQQTAGQRWVRCDLVDTSADLDSDVVARLRHGVPDQYRVCASTSGGMSLVACSEQHSYRLVYGASLPLDHAGPTPYHRYHKPAVEAAASRLCRRHVHSTRVVFQYPTAAEWGAGRRFVSCFLPDGTAS